MIHHVGMERYFLKNDFVFPLKYVVRRYSKDNSKTELIWKYNNVSKLGEYLYSLNKLTNITKVHVIGYHVDIVDLIPILNFYANIIYNYCNKRLILHIDTNQKNSLKKTKKILLNISNNPSVSDRKLKRWIFLHSSSHRTLIKTNKKRN